MSEPTEQPPQDDKRKRPARSRAVVREQLLARLQKLDAAESKAKRKLRTKRLIILGGTLEAAARHDPQLQTLIVKYLDQLVTKPADRKAIEPWLPKQESRG